VFIFRVKELESKVAERDAMIKVLQKHTSAAYDSGASLRNNSSREELGKCSYFFLLKFILVSRSEMLFGLTDI
jgi:hypothetical protein